MASFSIRYNEGFADDLSESFSWGERFWGKSAAIKWYNQLEDMISERLSEFPESCQVAPESEDTIKEVRHLIYGRYRILFTIEGQTVHVIHLRGPYHRP